MAFIPKETVDETANTAPEKTYPLTKDVPFFLGTFPKGNRFRIIFLNDDQSYAQVEDAEPQEGTLPFQIYIETKLLKGAPQVKRSSEVLSPSKAAAAPVEAPELIVDLYPGLAIDTGTDETDATPN